ncbi:unnamed protein product [Mycena citricolor]|uniref:threonine--tRNA ligase n=1 Tax=Mycena citricolor TaxID=2018698 RepID=A0AAD2K189_9AGAR|nr:unnamed protein product [Mycena citricolor]
MQIAESISPRLAQEVLSASVNGEIVDLNRPINEDSSVKLHKWEDPEGKKAFWHSSSHLLAEALEALYPGIKFGIGPSIENGFYYDIEKKMEELARTKEAICRREVSKSEAMKTYTEKGDQYKVELIEGLEDGTISFYTNGDQADFGGRAYWRGNENNKMLTRIYGITFPKKSMLDEYLAMLEEAKKRDHRKLGKELELFCFSPRVGAGLPLWLPKGAALRDRLEHFLRNVQKQYGYLQRGVSAQADDCPHHCEIYKFKPRSYKDLPLRFAEFGTVYRYEQSGELHGLTRVRGFTQDDAHIFCRPDQLKDEFMKVSLRDPNNKEKYIGSDEKLAQGRTVDHRGGRRKGTEYDRRTRGSSETIQVDYNLPERFDLTYKGSDDKEHRPIMIHRAPFGSMERFVAVLLEHTGGKFPLWLSPDQVVVLPISEKFNDYAKKVSDFLIIPIFVLRWTTVTRRSDGRSGTTTETDSVPADRRGKGGTGRHGGCPRPGEGDKGVMTKDDFVGLIRKMVADEIQKLNK